MSEYTFELNAVDNASPVVQEAVQRIRAVLEQGSAQLSSALEILPRFDPAAFNQLLTSLNATADRAVAQARQAGAEIGTALSQGIVPDQTLGVRLNNTMRVALAEMRAQIAQFNDTIELIPGGTRGAPAVLEFATEFQQAMLHSIQTVATELRTELNAAARSVEINPRQVVGQFQGASAVAASTRQLATTVGGTEDLEAFQQRLEARHAAGDPVAQAQGVVAATDELLAKARTAVLEGQTITQQELGALRQAGIAFDLRDPTSKGLTPISGPVGVRDIGQGGPSVYQPGQGEGTQYNPIEQTVQHQRALERATEVLDREAAAEQQAAIAAEEKAAADRRAATVTTLVRDPATVRLGSGLNAPFRSGEGNFFSASGEQYTEQAQINQLEAQYVSMLRRRNAETEALIRNQQDQRGVGGAFLGGATGRGFDAHAGFDPVNAVGNLAGTAGVLLRYGAIGIAITSAFRGLTEIKTQIVDYQSSLTNLDEILASTGSQQTNFNATIDAAAPAGIGAAQALDIAAEAAARYHDEILAGANAGQIMQTTLANVGQAAVLSGQDAKTAAEQLIDATQGFSLGSTGQSRILDAVENARKNFGGDRGQIMQAIGDAGDLASQAGVNPEQLANIVALIQARTGASGTAVASAFERTVSRQGTSSFRQALGGLGIEDTGNITSEIVQLSKAYDGLTRTQQEALISQLGGARQARELLPLLEDGKQLVDANTASYRGAGAAAGQYAAQQATLAGEIRQIGGEFKDLANELGQSGLFDIIGPIVIGFKDAVQGVDELVRAFDLLPRPLRDVAFYALEALAAVRLFGSEETKVAVGRALAGIPVLGPLSQRIGLGPQVNAAETEAPVVSAETKAAGIRISTEEKAAEIRLATEREAAGIRLGESIVPGVPSVGAPAAAEEGAAAPVFYGPLTKEASAIPTADLRTAGGLAAAEDLGAGAAFGAAGGALVGLLTNPVTLAIGGLIAIGGVTGAMHHLNDAAAQGSLALNALTRADDSKSLTTAADALASARQQLAQGSSGPFGTIAGFFKDTGSKEAQYQAAENFARASAARIAAEQATQAGLPTSVFGPTNDITTGLTAMAQSGVDANTQLRAVAEALGLVTTSAGGTAASVLAGVHSQQIQPGLRYSAPLLKQVSTYQATLAQGDLPRTNFSPGDVVFDPGGANRELLYGLPNPADVTKRVLASLGKPSGGLVSPDDLGKIADAYVNSIIFGPDGGPKGSAADQAAVRAAARRKILANLQSLQGQSVTNQTGPISNEELNRDLNGNGSTNPGLLSVINSSTADPFDPTGGAAQLKTNVQILQSYANRADPAGTYYPELIQALHTAEDKLATARIADIEKLRAAADARHTPQQDAHIDQGYFDKEIQAAGADTGQLIGVINQMSSSQIHLVEHMLRNQVKVAQAAEAAALQIAAHLPSDQRTSLLAGSQGKLDTAQANLQAFLDSLLRSTPAGTTGPTAQQQARLAQIESAAQPGNDVQNAQVALRAAQYQLDNAHKGTSDYYNALKAVNDAKYQLAQAESSQAQAAIQSTAQPGNDLQNAQVTLRAAEQQLATAHTGTAAYYNALKAVNDARYQLTQTESSVAQAAAAAKVYPGSELSSAREQIIEAKDALSVAVAGTQAYFQALGQLHDAQIAYGNALLQYHSNERLLAGDPTDPVFTAHQALVTARDQLRADRRRGAPRDVIATDRLAVKDDQNAAQAAAFQQRFTDLQNLHDLGALSDRAYLNHLEREHERLSKIKDKTRQQIDELNQIDQAIHAADLQMEGQWNIGDIHIPTPYEAARYVKAHSMGDNYDSEPVTHTHNHQVSNTVNNNQDNRRFDFKGLDRSQVVAILKQELGEDSTHRSGTASRKGM